MNLKLLEIGNHTLFQLLIFLIFLDILTGVGKAFKQKTLSSNIGIVGMIKHLIVVLITIGSYIFSSGLGYTEGGSLICLYFISFYGLSLIENLVIIGIPVPAYFKEYLNIISSKNIINETLKKDKNQGVQNEK